MAINVHEVFANYFDVDTSFKAAIYAVSEKLEQGHICLDIEAYNTIVTREENPFLMDGEIIEQKVICNNKLVAESLDYAHPFILKDGKFYLQRYFNYQSQIHDKIKAMVTCDPTEIETGRSSINNLTEEINRLFPPSIETDWQKVGAISAVFNRFTIISGGPGTGKTTTVAKILALLFLQSPELKVALCAPTGKAAARMNESLSKSKERLNLTDEVNDAFTHIDVSTIQRLLGYQRNSIYFRYNADNPLPYDLIIVDEASMISAALISKLLQAVSSDKKIILLGDKYQLASVEAGSIFGDLCSSIEGENIFSQERFELLSKQGTLTSDSLFQTNKSAQTPLLIDHIITLQKSYRFSDDKGIGKLAKEILNNKIDISYIKKIPKGQDEFVFLTNDYEDKILNNYVDFYRDYLKEKDITKVFDAMNKVRVLCAVREGKNGIYHYNQYIESYLSKKKLIKPLEGFYHNQPIIITKNDYTHGLFNGDIGIVRRDKNDRLRAYFEDPTEGVRSVSTAIIEAYETVFAMTIHKSQGSEFDHVVIILPENETNNILSRQLLYTAVTRAKKDVLIIGADQQLQNAVNNKVSRASGLAELMQNGNNV